VASASDLTKVHNTRTPCFGQFLRLVWSSPSIISIIIIIIIIAIITLNSIPPTFTLTLPSSLSLNYLSTPPLH